MTQPILFLDIDGVLNDHKPHANGYNGLNPANVARMNAALAALPDCRIVLSSAWRYLHHHGQMTVDGLESLLLTHGLNCYERIVGVTKPDAVSIATHPDLSADEWTRSGLEWRATQIREWVTAHDVQRFAVLDDLPLDLPELVQTDPKVGLTPANAREVVRLLAGDEAAAAFAIEPAKPLPMVTTEQFALIINAARFYLRDQMSAESESRRNAGWHMGCEFVLWKDQLPELVALAKALNGWWACRHQMSDDDAEWVPMAEWLPMYAEWEKGRVTA